MNFQRHWWDSLSDKDRQAVLEKIRVAIQKANLEPDPQVAQAYAQADVDFVTQYVARSEELQEIDLQGNLLYEPHPAAEDSQ